MTKAMFPGSFDPMTNGHLDLIERTARMFDEVVVVLAHNTEKKTCFSLMERMTMLQEATKHIKNVRCVYCEGLLAKIAKQEEISVIIRGVRNVQDFTYEKDIAAVNRYLDAHLETLLLYADGGKAFISSTIVKELLHHGKSVRGLVPDAICPMVEAHRGKG